jgi:hypothetical protein
VGAWLSLCGLFKLYRRQVIDRRVSAGAVVEDFDVFKETLHRLYSCSEMLVMHQFLLESREALISIMI